MKLNLNKLKDKLKDLVISDRNRNCALAIEETAEKMLGKADNFIHSTNDARYLAEIDINKLKAFIAEVERIKVEYETTYSCALDELGEISSNET